MGLKSAQKEVIKKLKDGYIQHDVDRSGEIEVKNLLLTGEVSVDEVVELVNKTKGGEFESSPHHYLGGVEVYIFKPGDWYIKCYFIEPDVVFISVHK